MKQTTFICLLALAMTGCTANPTPESGAYVTDAPTEAETLHDEIETPVEETTEAPAFIAPTEAPSESRTLHEREHATWEQAYRTFLEPYFNTEALFSLIDVCGDRTPELFFADDKNTEAPVCQLYTYTEAEGFVSIGEMKLNGEISLNLQNDYILYTSSSDGYDFYSAHQITEDNTLKTLITLILDNSSEDSVWYINDEIVSEEAFDSALEEYGFNWDLIILNPRCDVTEEEIDTAINHSNAPPAF